MDNCTAISCPECGFTKESLINDNKATIELVRSEDMQYRLLFLRNKYTDESFRIHFCPKCGFKLDDIESDDCGLCNGNLNFL